MSALVLAASRASRMMSESDDDDKCGVLAAFNIFIILDVIVVNQPSHGAVVNRGGIIVNQVLSHLATFDRMKDRSTLAELAD